jgi:hypothetical protein
MEIVAAKDEDGLSTDRRIGDIFQEEDMLGEIEGEGVTFDVIYVSSSDTT